MADSTDISYTPNYAGNRRMGTYLNQYGATSGRTPSYKILDDIIQNELDAAYSNIYRNKALAEQKRQFDTSQQNAADTASANRQAGLVGMGTQLLGTGLMAETLRPGIISNLFASGGGGGAVGTLPETAGYSFLPGGASATEGAASAMSFLPEAARLSSPITVAGNTSLGSIPASEAAGAGAGAAGVELAAEGPFGPASEAIGAGSGAGFLSYAAPAAAAYAGAELGGSLAQTIGEAVGVGGESERGFVGKVGGGALAGTAILPGIGTVIGAGVGLIDWAFDEGADFVSDVGHGIADVGESIYDNTIGQILPTWLCTEVSNRIGFDEEDFTEMKKLRKYTLKNHRDFLGAYMLKGKALVQAINATEDPIEFYTELKEAMIVPILDLIKEDEMEKAFEKYRDDTNALIKKYAPELKEGIE
jgi:hypothetical protein